MLAVEKLHAWYDRSHVVQGVSLAVKAGEIVTLMGRISSVTGSRWPTSRRRMRSNR